VLTSGDTPHSGAGDAANVEDLITAQDFSMDNHGKYCGRGTSKSTDAKCTSLNKDKIVGDIRSASRLWQTTLRHKRDFDQKSFTANGPRRELEEQAAREGNQAFWMFSFWAISATNTKVTADGHQFATTWHIHDHF